jgi:hypothetical protein
MTRRKGILGTTEIKRNILLTFWDKKKRDFLLRLRDGGSIYDHSGFGFDAVEISCGFMLLPVGNLSSIRY